MEKKFQVLVLCVFFKVMCEYKLCHMLSYEASEMYIGQAPELGFLVKGHTSVVLSFGLNLISTFA